MSKSGRSVTQQQLKLVGLICLGLALVTWLAFWPVGRLGFINLDDYGENGYVVDNVNVHSGITAASLKWAFTAAHSSNWHPVTWISHMLDYQWFGANPAGHHWVNLGWHIANVVLLFLLLNRATGRIWLAALAAGLFAVHPLRVESVAWVSERKDVLSGFFFLLTLWCWVKHGQKSSSASHSPAGVAFWRSGFYWLALGACALGLMSKPMLVTLPLILLLLDFWPLERFASGPSRGAQVRPSRFDSSRLLLLEKLPFVALALASCGLTIWAQSEGAAIVASERLPVEWRLLNVPLTYAAYLKAIFWPGNLVVFYDYKHIQASLIQFGAIALGFTAATVYCCWQRVRQPWLLVGWVWFVVMLIPVIGLIQVGAQSMADRYTYLPSIGISILVCWSLGNLALRFRAARLIISGGAGVVMILLVVLVRVQLRDWRDSVTLFNRALTGNGDNNTVQLYLANALRLAGDLEGATTNYRAILTRVPQSEDIRYRLSHALLQQQKYDEAGPQFEAVLKLNPASANAHMGLAYIQVSQRKFAAATEHFLQAMLLRPGDPDIKASFATAFASAAPDQALTNLLQRLSLNLNVIDLSHLAMIQLTQNNYAEAAKALEAALRLEPDASEVLNQLAWLRATCRDQTLLDGASAVTYATRACEVTGNHQARTMGTLAAALARSGRFDAACAQASKACALAAAAGENDLVARNRALLEMYRNHQAYDCPD